MLRRAWYSPRQRPRGRMPHPLRDQRASSNRVTTCRHWPCGGAASADSERGGTDRASGRRTPSTHGHSRRDERLRAGAPQRSSTFPPHPCRRERSRP
eukprot:5928040-Prymnesium_polylepis.1